jgi:WD40 repeat protein/serine/threonine protein kinase
MSTTGGNCPECGSAIPANAPRGLCPRCLIQISDDSVAPPPEALISDLPPVAAEVAPPPSSVRYFGDYELLQEIGRGGMGVIYRARQLSLNRIVAVKMIAAGRLASPVDVQRFRAEAEAVANLDHPNIVPIYEIGEHDGRHYFSMRFVEGGNLGESSARSTSSSADSVSPGHQETRTSRCPPALQGGPPGAFAAAAGLMIKVARAVHHAHQRGILHRDLKPGNILLDARAEPYVTDFGLAKALERESNLTRTDAVLGTPNYMSPEQASGKPRQLTTGSDIFSLGSILYELLTGRTPFQGKTPVDTMRKVVEEEPRNPRSINREVDPDLATVCLKCLQKAPGNRYETAGAFADDLERWRRGEPIQARPSTAWDRTLKWARRKPAMAALAIVSSVAFLALITMAVGLRYHLQLTRAYHRIELAQAAEELARTEAVEQRNLAQTALSSLETLKTRVWTNGFFLAGFDADGTRLLTDGQGDQLVRVWEGGSGQQVFAVEPVTSGLVVSSLAISRSGPWIAVAIHLDIWIWHLDSGMQMKTISGHTEAVNTMAFNSDATRLVTASGVRKNNNRWGRVQEVGPSDVRIWSLDSKVLRTLEGPRLRRAVLHVDYSPDDRWIAAADLEGTVRVWDAETGELAHWINAHSAPVRMVVFSPDGKYLACSSDDRTVKLWEVETGRELRTFRGHSKAIYSLAFSSDGRHLISGAADGVVKIWQMLDDSPIRTLSFQSERPGPRMWSVAFHGDGATLVAHGSAGLWLCDTEQWTKTQLRSTGLRQARLSLSPDGALIGIGGVVVEGPMGNLVRSNLSSRGFAYRSVFSADGSLFASGSGPKVRVWQTSSWSELVELKAPTNAIWDVAFSPDGRYLAAASGNPSGPAGYSLGPGSPGQVLLWEAESWRLVHALPTRICNYSVAFSEDGTRLVSAGGLYHPGNPHPDSGEVRVWDVGSGQLLHDLKGLPDCVFSAAFSPDGKRLVTAGGKHAGRAPTEILIWDAEFGQELLRLECEGGTVYEVAFSPDGHLLAAACDDGTVRIWDATPRGEAPRKPSELMVKAERGR